jgi:hypothetical protein
MWGSVLFVQHQLSGGICTVKWRSFDDFGNDAATEICSGEFGSWQKPGNHHGAVERRPESQNHGFSGGYRRA